MCARSIQLNLVLLKEDRVVFLHFCTVVVCGSSEIQYHDNEQPYSTTPINHLIRDSCFWGFCTSGVMSLLHCDLLLGTVFCGLSA